LKRQVEVLGERLHIEEEEPPTYNKNLLAWVESMRQLCKPDRVYWCTGTEDEYDKMCDQLVKNGTFIRLNDKLRPNSYLARSDPKDVARVESCTYICSKEKSDAGPTNNWEEPEKMKQKLTHLFDGCMKGRTMYVVPFCMGPLGSPFSRYGVEVTDSAYVVVNTKIMTRMGTKVLTALAGNCSSFFASNISQIIGSCLAFTQLELRLLLDKRTSHGLAIQQTPTSYIFQVWKGTVGLLTTLKRNQLCGPSEAGTVEMHFWERSAMH
jgi:GTP-dependent phosphoenolpyruvate carboxykinase